MLKDYSLPAPEQHNAQTALHTIQAGKRTRPFFLLHGNWTGGVPFYCYTLARTLGPEQPFYALDPFIFNGPCKPMSIEEMAAAHLEALRVVQPEGPYQLGGFCNGSLLAYEMARQLHAQGQQVTFLSLIAPISVSTMRQVVVRSIHAISTLLHIQPMHQLISFLRLRHAARHVYSMLYTANDLLLQDFPKLLAIDARLHVLFPPTDALLNDYVGIFTWLAALYKKRFMPEYVDFIWFDKELAKKKAWKTMEKDPNSAIVPGHHTGGVTEHADLVAQVLQSYLQRANHTQAPAPVASRPL
jgi:thioesterase domain-containing protein